MLRLFALLALFVSATVFAQASVPDTPAGKVFSALLTSFNSADPEQIAAFDKTCQQTRISVKGSLAMREHTGGTGDIFGPDYDSYRLALRDHDAYIKQFGARPLLKEPGTGFQYSNYGFVLLGAMIERVSGMSYYDYVDKKV